MNSLALFCPSTGQHEEAVTSWQDTMSKPWPISVNATTEGEAAGFLTKCNEFWRNDPRGQDATIIGYLHSDLFIHEHGWDQRVRKEFGDPRVAVVGFVGARLLGTDDLYKLPYDHRQLARGGVIGNLTDMEVHGERITGSEEVAVVDSCAVFVRREFLAGYGGWPVERYPDNPHCSDLYICLAARSAGCSVSVVGIACTHRSGGKGDIGARWLDERGGDAAHHRAAHKQIYHEFREILPVRIPCSNQP